jgi:MFS family permease
MAEYLGRRGEMLLSAGLYFFGGLLEMLASVPSLSSDVGLMLLVAGRLVFGLGIGFAMHAVPTYISEMGPPKIRGALISAKEAMIVMGMVLGYAIGYGFSSTDGEGLLVWDTSTAPRGQSLHLCARVRSCVLRLSWTLWGP